MTQPTPKPGHGDTGEVHDRPRCVACMREDDADDDPRRPLPPAVLASALTDRIHKDTGRGRAADVSRVTLFSHLHETPIDRARRERAEHLDACDRCIAGLDCPTGDDLDRRLEAAIEADLPWSATSTLETL